MAKYTFKQIKNEIEEKQTSKQTSLNHHGRSMRSIIIIVNLMLVLKMPRNVFLSVLICFLFFSSCGNNDVLILDLNS